MTQESCCPREGYGLHHPGHGKQGCDQNVVVPVRGTGCIIAMTIFCYAVMLLSP